MKLKWDHLQDIQEEIMKLVEDEEDEEEENKSLDDIRKEYRNIQKRVCSFKSNSHQMPIVNDKDVNPSENWVSVMKALSLPKRQIKEFNGDPIAYHAFMATFLSIVKDIPNDVIKLNTLISSCTGPARASIEFTVMKPPGEGFNAALHNLERKFGSKSVVSQAWISKVMNKNVIDVTKLSEYSYDLENCYESLDALGYLNELDNQASLKQIIDKLPRFLQNRWRCEHQKIKEQGDDTRLRDVIRFVKGVADEMNDPVFGIDSTSDRSRNIKRQVNQIKSEAAPSQNPVSGQRSFIRNKCWLCKSDNHYTDQCEKMRELTPEMRYKLVKDNHACFSCLKIAGRNHRMDNCTKKRVCGEKIGNKTCERYHHKLLHIHKVIGSVGFLGADLSIDKQPLLMVLDVEVITKNGTEIASVILDGGSQGTFVTKSFAEKTNADGNEVSACVTKFGGEVEQFQSKSYQITLKSNVDGSIHKISALETDFINEVEPVEVKDLERAFDLREGALKRRGGSLDILIGLDHAHLHIGQSIIGRERIIMKTPLGWVVFGGKMKSGKSVSNVLVNHVDMTKFWTTEGLGVDTGCQCSKEVDNEIENKMIEDSCEKVDGHWLIPYPWRKDPNLLQDNKIQAEIMLRGLERRLLKDPEKGKMYKLQMDEMVKLGFARKLTSEEIKNYKGPTHYIPHHAVIKKDSKSTPLRIVFNSSNKYKGESINDFWIKGPDMLNNLNGVLIRFREKKVALCADISKMYHRIKVPEIDQHTHRYLWRDLETTKEPDTYVKTVLTFGDKPACTMAITALNMTARENVCEFPEACKVIIEDSYMDDICPSVDTKEEAVNLTRDVDKVLSTGGFETKGWISNVDLHGNGIISSEQKVLGVMWDPKEDKFRFEIEVEVDKVNKRKVLGVIAKVFDPVGFIVPVVITTKIFLQELWERGLDWDEKLPPDLEQRWVNVQRELKAVEKLTFPRCLTPCMMHDDASLVVFCDASQEAFGACVYLRCKTNDNEFSSTFVAAKSRVAPVKKKLTIPRLELQGAVIGARLVESVTKELTVNVKETYMMTDSMIVLAWIKKPADLFKQFVSVRVAEIKSKTATATWKHVPGVSNPADDLSRGVRADELKGRWINGPDFLRRPVSDWPSEKIDCVDKFGDEEKRPVVCGQVMVEPGDDIDLESFETWEDLQEAYRVKVQNEDKEVIDAELVKELEILMLMRAQRESFPEAYSLLKKGITELKNSKLSNLAPEFDTAVGLIRVGGRLRKANVDIDPHPYVLDSKHPITRLLIKRVDANAFNHSAGYEQVFSCIRRKYWILKGRSAIKSVLRVCTECQRWRSKPVVPRMADVPQARLRIGLPVFYSTGMDCFGPYMVKIGRRIEKRWAVLFKCMTSRAIHIELLEAMSVDCFIMAFRRFVARKGTPVEVYSDCGTNFTGADKELQKCFREMSLELQKRLAKQKVSFKFNPPNAPHFGGIWEREVKAIKNAMRCCMKERVVPEVILQTIVVEVEGLMNSKPLGYTSSDISDADPITPNMLLMGRRDPVLPLAKISPTEVIRSNKQWRHSQIIIDLFWKRFVNEYLPSQQIRQKWTKESENLKKGDAVLIIDQQAQRGEWLTGVVKEVYPSVDGKVRVADVETGGKAYKRPVIKLIKLEKLQ